MTIISLDKLNGVHQIQSQSNRDSCWVDGFIKVPEQLEAKALDTLGFCDLIVVDGELVDIVALEIPTPAPPQPTPEEDLMSMMIDQEYRLTLLEMGL